MPEFDVFFVSLWFAASQEECNCRDNNKLNVNEVNNDFVVDGDDHHFVAFEDNDPDVPIDQDALENEEDKCEADHSVFNSYEKLLKLQSNPLGLERFSREKKVQIELL